MRLVDLISVKRVVPVDYYGESIDVAYRPSAFNEDYWAWMQAHGNEAGSVREGLERVLVSWDVLDTDGKPLPTTAAVMRGEHPGLSEPFPIEFLNTVSRAIHEDRLAVQLGKRNGTASPAG